MHLRAGQLAAGEATGENSMRIVPTYGEVLRRGISPQVFQRVSQAMHAPENYPQGAQLLWRQQPTALCHLTAQTQTDVMPKQKESSCSRNTGVLKAIVSNPEKGCLPNSPYSVYIRGYALKTSFFEKTFLGWTLPAQSGCWLWKHPNCGKNAVWRKVNIAWP